LDATCALALVQEEVMDSGKKKESRTFSRSTSRQPYQWPGPPKFDKPLHQQPAEDKRVGELSRADLGEDKLKALKQYQRARDLCERCVEKWMLGHKCAPTVQLHVMQELWELLYEEDSPSESVTMADCAKEQGNLCVFLSEAVVQEMESPKSMMMLGQIQGVDIMILVDSGSSHTFIKEAVAEKLQVLSVLSRSLSVKVANGNKIDCSIQLQHVVWELQGCQFCSDFKVIPLEHFDVILGYNWLETFSPMRVHWKEKWLAIPYDNSTVVLQGILSTLCPGTVVKLYQLSEDDLNLDDDKPIISVADVPS
jgi:hypothetical protein